MEHQREVAIVTKKALAKKLGVGRSSLYYKPKREALDGPVKAQITGVLKTYHDYGHKRIALALRLNKKRIARVMKKYGIHPYKLRAKKPHKREDEGKKAVTLPNSIKQICPIRPDIVWAADFTYLKFQGSFLYVATVIDVYTREIIGIAISKSHDVFLVLDCLKDAIRRRETAPVYLHMDQGSEYTAGDFTRFVRDKGILLSYSKKASPWENGFQEAFYSGFKLNLGMVERFTTQVELIEEIYKTFYYYNHKRIHSALKMSPAAFKNYYLEKQKEYGVRV